MSLQNRVFPDGTFHAVPARGTFMGNRGRLHDPVTKTLLTRQWALKAWLICQLSFNNRQRNAMGHSYTELFFMDEVTALSSGHRPCYECRRQAFKKYQLCWQKGLDLSSLPKASTMDCQLHQERLLKKTKRQHILSKDMLVDGAFLLIDKQFYALKNKQLLLWHFSGYTQSSLEPF